MSAQHSASVIRFGHYEFDGDSGELRKDGRKLRLPAQAIQVLGMLLERPSELVTREQINARLWPNGTIVEFDHGVNACVRRLRAVLNDSAEQPRYIETLPKRGYRFIFPCEPLPGRGDNPAGSSAAGLPQYRIVSTVGAGSMGVVYRAIDTTLGREVALKMPAEELLGSKPLLEAFAREARAAAALNHPNICTIFGVGEQDGRPFIAMEFLRGETLSQVIRRRASAIDEVISLALQTAAALAAAHAKGIVHRDIKPSNIFVLAPDTIKLLDFGVAKCFVDSSGESTPEPASADAMPGTPRPATTFCGVRAGTLPYMSPEQLQGCSADARSDVFSFGGVLYELLTHRKPFDADTPEELLTAIESAPAPRLREIRVDIPAELEDLIAKCLRRNPAERWQTAQDIVTQLGSLAGHLSASQNVTPRRWIWRGTAAACACLLTAAAVYMTASRPQSIDSVAVLPFVNATHRPETEYLSDGITEAIINNLTAASRLKVSARTAVFRFKGREFEPHNVGRALGAQTVLTGTVSQRGNSLVVQADLVRTSDGSQLWGEQFTGTALDLQNLQNQIARDITDKLRLKLTGEEQKRLTKQYTGSSEAYDLYLKGIHAAPLRHPGDTMNALLDRIDYLQQAVARDPVFATAYVALAESYYALGASRYSPGSVVFGKQRQAANTALRIDDTIGEGHVQLALALWHVDWDWAAADKEFKRAIELNTNSAHAHYAVFLMQLGHRQQALERAHRALELDPVSESTVERVAFVYAMGRLNEQALELARRLSAGRPSFTISFTLSQMGRYEEAVHEFEKMSGNHGPAPRGHLAHAFVHLGRVADAQRLLQELKAGQNEQVGAYEIAFVYAALGNRDEAFKWLDKAYEQRDSGLTYLKTDHTLDPLRSDPRFRELEQRVGLSQ